MRAYEPQNDPETAYWDECSALLSCTTFGSLAGGGDRGPKKASNSNCTFFPGCLVSHRLAVEGTGVGGRGVRTRTMDICAIGAQSYVTTAPERSYVMDP